MSTIIVIMVTLFFVAYLFIIQLTSNSVFNNNFFEIALPPDAQNIVYEVNGVDYNKYAFLSFDASPAHVSQITAAFCDGEIHQSYDPFNAVNTIVPVENSYLIKMPEFTYYSHSSGKPQFISGNRCWESSIGMIQFSVDAQAQERYRFNLLSFSQENWKCDEIPCKPLGSNYVQPIENVPLLIIGLQEAQTSNHLKQIHDEICVDLSLGYDLQGWMQVDMWSYLVDSTFEIKIDNEIVDTGTVSESGDLMSLNTNQSQNWGICFEHEPTKAYVLAIDIVHDSERDRYHWNVDIE